MPKFLTKRWHGYHVITLFVIALLFAGVLFSYNWFIGVGALVLLSLGAFMAVKLEVMFQRELKDYLSTLSHRIKKVGDEALTEMPIGILLYDEEYRIEWVNSFITSIVGNEALVGNSINHLSADLIPLIKGESKSETLLLNKRFYLVHFQRDERLLYFFDITEQQELEKKYYEDQTVLGIVYLDNYDEVTQGLEDQVRSNINSQVTEVLNRWATDYGIFLKRSSSEKFFAVFNEKILAELEKNKFSVLDEVRDLTSKQHIPITLSIGVGTGLMELPELGQLAQSSLDLALGRGGDQVAIKQFDGKVKFYGGKTNPIEKRTRVRARVISHALRELVLDSDQVIVMGHKRPDMDAIGASIGILKLAQANQTEGMVVFEKDKQNIGVSKLIEEVAQDDELWDCFISPEEALEKATPNTLLVVVDTHKPSLVIEEKLVHKLDRVVVIDHHRRGEEFVTDPVLVYMEPYASSTCELVTELFEYQPKTLKLSMLEATSLLAGISVDTKNFTLRTGSRTFDAASYLRAHGADTILVQKLLSEEMEHFIQRAHLIENATLYREGIVIAVAQEDQKFDQVLIAQTADALLSIKDVVASFVISKRLDGKISISARSLGDINVQVIMEALNGGGHLTNAATQLEDGTLEEADEQLKMVIDQYMNENEGGEEE